MSGSGCLDDDTLALFVAGLLGPEDLEGVDRHLADCDKCSWLAAVGAPQPTDYGPGLPPARAHTERFELLEIIGEGAMGIVHRAYDRLTGATVAVKRLRVSGCTDLPRALKRFSREMALLDRLAHPNIVKVIGLIESSESPEIVMEYVGGGSLRANLRAQRALPVERVVAILLELSDALARAHHKGVVHRDLKPDNVLLAADGSPRLADFGLARLLAGNSTSDGKLMGTLPYMSPEALDGGQVDEKTDLWALGVMGFELLTGRRPFHAEPASALIAQILLGPVGDLAALCPEAPAPLVELTYALLARNPLDRPSARAVGAALEPLRALPWRAAREHPGSTQWLGIRAGQQRRGWATFPTATVPFIGRREELAALCDILTDAGSRLVTVLGPGGTGKSRLAIEAARRLAGESTAGEGNAAGQGFFSRGACFVDLTLIRSPELAATAIAAALAFALRPGVGAREQLCDFLREKAVLLVMDNFEHVLPAADLVNALLQAAPRTKVLATSREPLNLSAETRFALGGMKLPRSDTTGEHAKSGEASAVELFLTHARRARSGFELGEAPGAVEDICRLVEGMPLGIVLAAGWLHLLSPEDIREEIAHSLDFLKTELRDLPARQRSLRAVFEHSWNLLGAREREVCARLSLFRGGFDRSAAAAICDAGVDQLAALVDKSFVVWDPASRRYHMHELLRQFAEEQLRAEDGAVVCFVQYYTQFVSQREIDLHGREHARALQEMVTELGNVRAAWQWMLELGDLEAAEAVVHGLFIYHYRRGDRADAVQQMAGLARAFESRAAQGEERARRVVAIALTLQGGIMENQGECREARLLISRALALLSGTPASREKGLVLILAGGIPLPGRDAATAVREAEQGLAMYRELGKPRSLPVALTFMARVHFETTKDLGAAARCLRESLDVQRSENAGELVLPGTLNGLALVRGAEGDWREAAELLQQAVAISERAGDSWAVEEALRLTAWIRSSVGDYDGAIRAARRCIDVCHETGARESIIWCHFIFGDAAIEHGRLDEAAAEFNTARALTAPGTLQSAIADLKLADVAARRGRLAEADAALRDALAIAEAGHTDWPIRGVLSALGHVACEDRRYADARGHWTRALERSAASPRPPALVSALADIALLHARTAAPERALELLGALVDQPSMSHHTRRWRIAPLLAELAESVPRTTFEAALLRGKARSLRDCVREASASLERGLAECRDPS